LSSLPGRGGGKGKKRKEKASYHHDRLTTAAGEGEKGGKKEGVWVQPFGVMEKKKEKKETLTATLC